MSDSRDLEMRSQSIATLLVRAGTDLTLCNKEGSSACTLILQARGGRQYLQDLACQHIDFFMLQEMACVDSWLMAALARALPTFQKSVQQQFKDCRTPTEISSSTRQIQESVPQFDTALQIE